MRHDIKNIVVTGVAAISAAGVGVEPFLSALKNSKSCLTLIPEEVGARTGALWGKAEDFRASDFMPPLKARKFDRSSLFTVVATGQALINAGWKADEIPAHRTGITLGGGFSGITTSEEFLKGYFLKGVDGLTPMLFPNTVANAPASNASIEHKFKGPNITAVQRFCSAEAAFQLACRFIEEGRADIMITGGVDELNYQMIHGFRELHQDKTYAAGFGEGCGLLVLERKEHAVSRGAKILAEIVSIKNIGRIIKGKEQKGFSTLLPDSFKDKKAVLSGTADFIPALKSAVPSPLFNQALVTGRSIAMGGLSMVGLVSLLESGETGIHISASPEGPYFVIEFVK
ncbi:MAG: beta-ketoacyl synthase [Desulfuromonadales bacterium]|nr:beta-ketoacyl synthase [Desulfuromonadales bacterium]